MQSMQSVRLKSNAYRDYSASMLVCQKLMQMTHCTQQEHTRRSMHSKYFKIRKCLRKLNGLKTKKKTKTKNNRILKKTIKYFISSHKFKFFCLLTHFAIRFFQYNLHKWNIHFWGKHLHEYAYNFCVEFQLGLPRKNGMLVKLVKRKSNFIIFQPWFIYMCLAREKKTVFKRIPIRILVENWNSTQLLYSPPKYAKCIHWCECLRYFSFFYWTENW